MVDGERGSEEHPARSDGEVATLLEGGDGVERRGGIAVGDQRRVAADGRGTRRGLDGLRFLQTGTADPGEDIDQARADEASRRVEHVGTGRSLQVLTDGGDRPVDDEDVGPP